MALTPKPLQNGSLLAAISPAGPVGEQEVERGIAAVEILGLRVEALSGALAQADYLAGEDSLRASQLTFAFVDKRFDGIISTRGGYGCARLLPLLDFDALAEHPKPLIGFSDITALQIALWQRNGLLSFSGPLLARSFGGDLDEWSRVQFRKMLFGESWGRPLDLPDGYRLSALSGSRAEGTLLGGNLAILASLCGTPDQPSFDGAIVVMEEIDEPAYRIDRMLTQLIQSGAFRGAAGILLGDFTQYVKGEAHSRVSTAEAILKDALPDIPILSGAPYGHVGSKWTLPIGGWAKLDADSGTLTVEPAR